MDEQSLHHEEEQQELEIETPIDYETWHLKVIDTDPTNKILVRPTGEPVYRITTHRTLKGKVETIKRIGPIPECATLARTASPGSGSPGSTKDLFTLNSELEKHGGEELVATITWSYFSLRRPVIILYNGKKMRYGQFLKAKMFSPNRYLESVTGEVFRWKLSSLSPRLYDMNNKRVAKYHRPFIPGEMCFPSNLPVIEVSDLVPLQLLDEIVVSLILIR